MTQRLGLDRLARPSGGFAMLAIDQREALRGMLAVASGAEVGSVSDQQIIDFKLSAARHLSPHASAVLMDVEWAAEPILADGCLGADTAMIIAADRLIGPTGGAAAQSEFDETIDMAEWRSKGASAFKLLIFWDPIQPGDHESTTALFVESCHKVGAPAVVEIIVRSSAPADESHFDRDIVSAAKWVADLDPDLYKAQMPGRGATTADQASMIARCKDISEAVRCPWVILSNGVRSEDFSNAVLAACRGGASGFLAGRAIWADAIASGSYETRLPSESVPRLRMLSALVDEHCRPWQRPPE